MTEYERGWRDAARAIGDACEAKERAFRERLTDTSEYHNRTPAFVAAWSEAGDIARALIPTEPDLPPEAQAIADALGGGPTRSAP